MVYLREVLESEDLARQFAIDGRFGKDIGGRYSSLDNVALIDRRRHRIRQERLLKHNYCQHHVQSATEQVKFLMIDPKVELNTYNGIPHLLAPA